MGVIKTASVSSGNLKWTTLAAPLAALGGAAFTCVVLVKRNATAVADGAAFDGQSYLLSGSGAGTVQQGFSFNGSDKVQYDIGAGSSAPTVTYSSKTAPYMIALSKAAGAVACRVGTKLGVAGSWSHENLSSAGQAGSTATMLQIASWQDSDFGDSWFGVVAWYAGAMSDVDKAALDDNWRTSDLWNSAHGQPLFLSEFNTLTPTDVAGNATGLTVTNCTLDGAETLDGWNFDGTGVTTDNTTKPGLATEFDDELLPANWF
jgi:hypothetical protein